MRRISIYLFLTCGSIIFAWPFIWMAATSAKLERELFNNRARIVPQAPTPRLRSPYVDTRPFGNLNVRGANNPIRLIEQLLPEDVPLADVDPSAARSQLARGIYASLLNTLPGEIWYKSQDELRSSLKAAITPPLIDNVSGQIRRSFRLGQLRARANDLREDELVAATNAATAWHVSGPASLVQQQLTTQPCAELHYNFSSANRASFSQTFKTSFPIEQLHRLQLYIQPDDTWHALRLIVEKLGRRFVAERAVYLADYNWQVVTWQEGYDKKNELTTIKTWLLLQPGGESDVRGVNEIKITFELDRSNQFAAWMAKISHNYRLTLDYLPFWRYVGTSLFLIILNLIGTVFSCSLAAYAFARLQWPGRTVSFGLLLATMMLPLQVTMIPQFLIMQKLGWYNTLKPLWVMSFFGSPFSIFLLRQYLKNIPRDLEDAARLDGCGFLRIYWHIMLPLIRPSLAVVAILTFLATWNDFLGPLIYLSDQRLYPLAFGLYAFQIQALQPGTGAGIGMLMAGSLLMMLPVIVMFFFAQRYFLQSVTLSGIKA